MQGGEYGRAIDAAGPPPTGLPRQIARKHAAVAQCLGEQPMVARAGNLDPAELRQMRGQELRVEQPEAAELQPAGEMNQRDLAGVGHPAEHALAEKRRPERDAVKAADKFAVEPALDAVRRAA